MFSDPHIGCGAASAIRWGTSRLTTTRRIEIHTKTISIRYIIDMAEIPTVSERSTLDTNGDGRISEKERDEYLSLTAVRLRNGISLRLDGKNVMTAMKPVGLDFVPGAGGLQTMRITLEAVLTYSKGDEPVTVDYHDENYDSRTGWKEIVLAPDKGVEIEGSDVSQIDMSRELTIYPVDATVAPPQKTDAHFIIRPGRSISALAALQTSANWESSTNHRGIARMPASSSNGAGGTPRDAFTQAIARGNLSGGLVLLSMVIAFVFGALHALSPGHGKAMMAAYLVGARGTARHAVLLGLVVTITHTIGVFALGIVMLAAAQFVVPERLYPALSALSGLTIAVMGAMLLKQRWSGLLSPDAEDSNGTIRYNTAYDNIPLAESSSGISSQFGDPKRAKAAKTGPLSVRSLVALGITGGVLPCPSALVVMLSAIALHRVAFGLILIVTFSAGLAVVLTSLGLCVVYVRTLSDRVSSRGILLQRLPTMSAAFVMLIGIFLIFKSLRGGGD